MSSKRYDTRFLFKNRSRVYKEQLTNRNIKHIEQYNTADFKELSQNDIMELTTRSHIWKLGDKFYKLAAKAYGSPKLWWIIPWFNQKPLESDYEPGETLYIPFPLSDVMEIFYQKNNR